MAPALLARVTEAVRHLGELGFGPLVALDSMGTYNPASKLPNGRPSKHALNPPQAIDVSGVEWPGGKRIRTLDRLTQQELYLRVEACLRLGGFGTVLGWDYGADHHNHWHCDYGQAFGGAGTSQTQFIGSALQVLGFANVRAAQGALGQPVDGQVGPVTLTALCKALIARGADRPTHDVGTLRVRIGATLIPYEERGGIAWAPLRTVCEALGATVDTSGYPAEIVVTPKE